MTDLEAAIDGLKKQLDEMDGYADGYAMIFDGKHCTTILEALRFQKAALGEVVIETICRRLHSQAYCNENVDSEWRDFEDNAGEILSDIRAELIKQVKGNKE